MKWGEKIYGMSPVWAQQLAINVYGWSRARRRLGPVFERTWRAYVDRESWVADRMNEFIESQLRQQVQLAYREVPYYRHAFRERGLTEEQLDRFSSEDLPKLPLLDRQILRTQAEALLTERAAKSPPEVFSTSGTTGTPARIYWDTETHQHNIAVREVRAAAQPLWRRKSSPANRTAFETTAT